MSTEYQIKPANVSDRNKIISLLQNEKLPTEDLSRSLDHFYVAIDNSDSLIGAIGLECHGNYGLLRSMVVSTQFRNLGIAAELVEKLQTEAKQMGFYAIYLLTETASMYFSRKGFKTINREDVPDEIKLSSEFSNVCPVSAAVMHKQLLH